MTKNNSPNSGAQPYLEITVNDVLQAKSKYGNTLHSVKASDKIAIAMQAMNAFNIGQPAAHKQTPRPTPASCTRLSADCSCLQCFCSFVFV